MPSMVKKHTKCRICGSKNLEQFLSLGKTPPANSFLKKEDFKKERSFPLRVGFCHNCNLVQLLDVVDRKALFSNYVYFYSAMPTASSHFGAYTDDVIKRFVADPKKDLIFEFGSNDGLLLRAFQKSGCKHVLGLDPAKNIVKFANKNGVPTVCDFLSEGLAKKLSKKYGKAKVVIGNNVVAHIDDHHDMIRAVKTLLDEKGVFVFEAPYLADMFENMAFDSIYHEHLSFLAVKPLTYLFNQFGMEIFDVKQINRQGNSIRVYAGYAGGHKVLPSVQQFLNKEKSLKLNRLATYFALAKKIGKTKDKLTKTLRELKQKGYSIAAYGAPARGNTLLNYCGINSKTLDFATEELLPKVGYYTPGSHIPVVHIEQARKNHPDFYLMLAWNYKDAIIKKEADFVAAGGKFITPVRGIEIV
ncbi:MAG: hypothetical protein A3J46_00700 [Candidatus Yanofskybacteria bacterium RIFCSPHIGHO2_02_FULL_41_11]|uniref:SAM-dependent methyltransferase n=1 Tax=Candidatus Yanofskybacteria bacterium RIFCSPHIGHO2_02_FULL_41_11 TaxID=1802675 RepID=A0A1F8FE45_9BACT|nr:MAG: hypothetical protein A3J46_00700 [Candidatus Yanofskybacteria bacterium RIFCSPHIGHO2_02_FULL_41_11]